MCNLMLQVKKHHNKAIVDIPLYLVLTATRYEKIVNLAQAGNALDFF